MVKFFSTVIIGILALIVAYAGVAGSFVTIAILHQFLVEYNIYSYLALLLFSMCIGAICYLSGMCCKMKYSMIRWEKGRKRYKSKRQFCQDILAWKDYYKKYNGDKYLKNDKVIKEIQNYGLLLNSKDEIINFLHKMVFEDDILVKEIYIFYNDYEVKNLITRFIDIDLEQGLTPDEFWDKEFYGNREKILKKYGYKWYR